MWDSWHQNLNNMWNWKEDSSSFYLTSKILTSSDKDRKKNFDFFFSKDVIFKVF